jgi:hypothetical protein
MWKWFLLALTMFCAVNWFLLPEFPILQRFLKPLTMYSAIGLSAILVMVSLMFSKGK